MNIREITGAAFASAKFDNLETDAPRPEARGGRLFIDPALLRAVSEEAFRRSAFRLRRTHLAALARILEEPGASENDRAVAETLLRNALVASEGKLPLCQDTGTATVVAWKDESVATGAGDAEELAEGARRAYTRNNLRSSLLGVSGIFEEFDTGDNLPMQVHIEAESDGEPGPSYRFIFIAKGGGSANKTSFFQMTKALLEEKTLEAFLKEKIAALGTAACPPYRLALVIGGTSPEENLRILKLATTELLDAAPPFVSGGEDQARARERGWIRRDNEWEERLMEIARTSGIGAQFGGSALALDARVLRLPRHAASCPVSLGVSCSAHRNVLAVIDADGVRIERLEADPAAYLRFLGGGAERVVLRAEEAASAPKSPTARPSGTRIPLDRPMAQLSADLSSRKIGDRLLLTGPLLLARDAAHLKWHALLAAGNPLPEYLLRYAIFYAGPAATPPGMVIGSLGPTTAQRMDGYAEELMSRGASLVTLAKGNRAPSWTDACKKYGGFYLGTIGGAAAILARDSVISNEIVDYPELGMEAVRLIQVVDLPAFLIVDDKGKELYSMLRRT
ncbi:MAG TPA: fumarate hydratase [Treponema sp.]|nr:MAG: fumarate hydratase [Treponema sp. GWC1_61_84]OHE69553.1 MAG: fumarate hydratase [Treponema sp. RIFOXYC1_FULL_61_9]HCM27283.1 fumarate hydratase [Treponema sp.]